MKVLELEEPGQLGNQFKMYVFKAGPDSPDFDQEIELQIASELSDHGGDKLQPSMMGPEKMRINFWV